MIVRPTIYPERTRFRLQVFGQRGAISAQAVAEYTATVEGEERTLAVILTDGSVGRQRRHLWGGTMVLCDQDAERRVVNFLSWWRGRWHPDRYVFEPREEVPFLVDGVPRARGAGMEVSVEPTFKDMVSKERVRVVMDIAVKGQGILVWASPLAGSSHLDPASLAEAHARGRRWVVHEGRAIQVDEGVDLGLVADACRSVVALSWSERSKLTGSLRLLRDARVAEEAKPLLRRILSEEPEDKVPAAIVATMRPYQVAGMKWLKRSIASGTGGILADQMGTGKTLQTISAYCGMKEQDSGFRMIVFAPKSLMGNWRAEFERFAPTVNVLVWDGPSRAKYEDLLPVVDVVVCSHDTYKRDREKINRYPFHLAVFDEAQVLKNADTALHGAAMECKAPVRLALTGTPIENRMEDLHAILAVASPGALPPKKEFKEKIVRPFQDGDKGAIEIMASQVQPLILRRTKDQVLTDLPPKTITDQLCEMTDAQAQLYEETKSWAKGERERAAASSDKRGAYLAILSRMRHVATDPRLAEPGRYRAEDSGKILALRSMMDELDQDESNKVLIFSQWTKCLELVRIELEERGTKFSYLTGETKNRDEQVHNFQTRHEVRYFLLGLKSGGVGLNITSANTVIMMDPWWNPASENQAYDRAHRFGQKRNVSVYRMISAGTVEQRIAELQAIKQAISDGVVDERSMPDIDLSVMSRLMDLR